MEEVNDPDMIQRTYQLGGIGEIPETADKIRDEALYGTASCKVLLAWAHLWEEDFSEFRQQLLQYFPDLTLLAFNSHSRAEVQEDRADESGDGKGCTLTFLFFENSGAGLHGIRAGYREEQREGRELRELILASKDPRGVLLIPPDYYNSTEDVLNELKDVKGVPVFGIKTSLLPGYRCFGHEAGGEVMEGCMLALIFHGEALNIRVHYNLGWTPVGKVMTVTKEENPFAVDEIDGKAASFVYNKYLGLRNEQIIPQNLSEFPLIIERNGIRISRIGITGPKDGQLIFGAPVYLNDRISLSYGNPDDLFSEVRHDTEEIAAFEAQAGFLIVCVNRVMLLKEREEEEIGLYRKQIREAASIYGYGELFYLDGRGGELNSALVSVSFKETGSCSSYERAEDAAGCGDTAADTAAKAGLLVPFHDRLSRMFKEMSGDLIMAVKDAEDANRAKSVFYSTVSHEIRTPLNSILGMNEMILKECADEGTLKYAESIRSSGKILQQLINDILDTGKIEAGKMEIVPVDYNVRKVMDELAEMISYSAKDKGLELKYIVDEGLPVLLHGDEKRIRQCILNLLSNAVKYTRTGEVVFRVGSHIRDRDHVMLDVSVKDSGIGIRAEDIEKLSVPFDRLDSSANYSVEGTGLGLNIVHNLLALMDSRLQIKSVYGQGSEFSFAIPQETRHVEEKRKDAPPAPAASSWGTLRTRDTSILVVDDTPMNLRLIQNFLKKSRIDIDTTLEGALAVEMAEKKKYDIIFLDRRMPGMDGLEVFHRIREGRGINAATPVVLLTADEGDDIREKVLKEGFSDYIPKPFSPSMLEEVIRAHLEEDKYEK